MTSLTIRINLKEPEVGFSELQQALASISHEDILAHLPDKVMKAASWLYDDDITAARAMLAAAERKENDLIRSQAVQEIELLKKTIYSGKIKSANYSVKMPAGSLNVIVYEPSACFIATACFGAEAEETNLPRSWRDELLANTNLGRKFIVWYYNNGEVFAELLRRSPVLRVIARACMGVIVKIVRQQMRRI